MAHQLSSVTRLVAAIKPTTVATSGTQSSTTIDARGFLSARAMCFMGLTSGDGIATLSILGSTATAGSFALLTGSTTASVASTTGQKDGLLVVDLTRLRSDKQFLQVNYVSATTLTQHGGVIVELYNPVRMPTTDQSTSLLQPQKVVWEAT